MACILTGFIILNLFLYFTKLSESYPLEIKIIKATVHPKSKIHGSGLTLVPTNLSIVLSMIQQEETFPLSLGVFRSKYCCSICEILPLTKARWAHSPGSDLRVNCLFKISLAV